MPRLHASLSTLGCALVLTAGALAPRAHAAVDIDIEGIGGEAVDAAVANLELSQYRDRDLSPGQLRRLVQRGEEQIRRGLEPFGFYEARAMGEISGEPGRYRVVYRVTPGERVLVRDARVQVGGPAQDVKEVSDALRAFVPALGQPLVHGLYEGSKAQITSALQTTGFFDAQLERHRVEVTRAERAADIDLAWDGGERYRFGAVDFSETQFPERFLRRYISWKEGEYYSTDELLTLQQRLVDADYFSSVSAQPEVDKRADGEVPVNVLLVPAKRTVYTASAYLSTDKGPGGSLGIDRRWVNRRGHKAGGLIEYSTRLQAISTYYRIPRPGERNRVYSFGGGYRDETTDSSRSRLARLSASETLDDWHGYTRTLGLQYLNGDFLIADELGSSRLLYFEGLLTRKRADNLMFPARGLSVTYGARLAAEGLVSDTSLVQVRGDAKWVRPLGRDSRLIARASLGALEAGDFDALPPELRFFAGGDRSIRGFDYEAIGERNASGGVIGGRYLSVASAELEWYFLSRWGVAGFVDAGDAYTSSFDMNVGAGIGVRWKSPVGIVRVDFAVPVRTDLDDDGLRFHIMIGPDL